MGMDLSTLLEDDRDRDSESRGKVKLGGTLNFWPGAVERTSG